MLFYFSLNKLIFSSWDYCLLSQSSQDLLSLAYSLNTVQKQSLSQSQASFLLGFVYRSDLETQGIGLNTTLSLSISCHVLQGPCCGFCLMQSSALLDNGWAICIRQSEWDHVALAEMRGSLCRWQCLATCPWSQRKGSILISEILTSKSYLEFAESYKLLKDPVKFLNEA